MDFKSFSLDKEGYNVILVIIDRLSKQLITILCHKIVDSQELAELFL
jgi:hypothetical protein